MLENTIRVCSEDMGFQILLGNEEEAFQRILEKPRGSPAQ
jgi:hypothetical protein